MSNSTVTSGSQTPLEESNGFFGKSAEPSDYAGNGGENDVALSFSDNAGSNYSMKNNVNFDHSTLLVMSSSQATGITMAYSSIQPAMTAMVTVSLIPTVVG